MFDPNRELLSTLAATCAARLAADAGDDGAWRELGEARAAAGDGDPDLAAAIASRDPAKLHALAEQWAAGGRLLPAGDRETLKRAMKAFRKSLKVTQLDAESKLSRSPMTRGAESGIVGIEPPPRYSRAVWEELVRQGRLVAGRRGTYELPPGG
ncbi:MAG: hypothetical protein AB1726_07260 [Planctomycetota bacterium]